MSEVERSDAELIAAVRAGDELAYGQLWARHEAAAGRLARQLGNPSNADDLVSESFLRVLRALQDGGGPDGAFRPYLFSTLRRINIDTGRSYYQRVALTDDETDLDVEPGASAADVLADDADSRAAWRAWESLPDATRTLLWHLLIEEETPATVAPLLGTSPNGVSSRAVRAKERLRQAFLQQHLQDADSDGCRRTRGRLGEYVRDALSARDRAEVDQHLDDCAKCKAALFEVADLNQTLRVIIAPIVLGGAAVAARYLAGAGALKAAAVVGTGAGTAAAGHAHWLLWLRRLRNLPGAATAATVAGVLTAAAAAAFVVHAATGSPAHRVVAVPPPVSASTSAAPVTTANPSPSTSPAAVIIAATSAVASPSATHSEPRPTIKPTHKATRTPTATVTPCPDPDGHAPPRRRLSHRPRRSC